MTPPQTIRPVCAAALTLAAWAMVGCSTTENFLSGDKIDYRAQAAKTAPLDVPPDLSQLAQEGRYMPQAGVVSASALRQQGGGAPGAVTATTGGPVVAPSTVGEVRILRDGQTRWLVGPQPPEQLYPLLRSFWTERGFVLETDSPELGILETDWAENRAKLPQDMVRRTIGRVFDSLFSTAERDRFRTRIERSPTGGSEVYIVHRGLSEVFTDNNLRDRTVWQPRPRDPELEAEFLTRLMVRLGSKQDAARTAVAAAAPVATTARAGTTPAAAAAPAGRALPAEASLNLAEGFDRAWRQVGVALDRSGFTVEDRDRAAGLYFVRYIDQKLVGKDEPNFFQRMFSGSKDSRPVRYRLQVKASGNTTTVTVLNSQGEADNGDAARQIIARLAEELR